MDYIGMISIRDERGTVGVAWWRSLSFIVIYVLLCVARCCSVLLCMNVRACACKRVSVCVNVFTNTYVHVGVTNVDISTK